jgi:hypothetical protein
VVIDASHAGAQLPGIGVEGLQSLGHRSLPPFRRPHSGVDSRALPRGAPALHSATRPSQRRRRHGRPRGTRKNTRFVLIGRRERKGIRVTFRASRRSSRRNAFRSGVASGERRRNAGHPGTAPRPPNACGAHRRPSSGGTSAAWGGRTSSVSVFRFARGERGVNVRKGDAHRASVLSRSHGSVLRKCNTAHNEASTALTHCAPDRPMAPPTTRAYACQRQTPDGPP